MSDSIGPVDLFERTHVRVKRGRTLIVGSKVYEGRSDRRSRFDPPAFGVDRFEGAGVDLVYDYCDGVMDLGRVLVKHGGRFAHVECMSVLEHCTQPFEMAAKIEALMEPDATLFITAPFVWRIHAYPDDYWRFSIAGVKQLFQNIDWLAEAYAHFGLNEKLPAAKLNDHPYFARTESCLFGRKRPT